MREILFRGKRAYSSEWIYGYPLDWSNDGTQVAIVQYERAGYMGFFEWVKKCSVVVSPKTVGQYTGVKDKNDKRIFEGDIIEVDRIYDTLQPRPRRFTVEWEESTGFFPLTVCRDGGDYLIDTDSCEVIGNIWDNPELLFEVNE